MKNVRMSIYLWELESFKQVMSERAVAKHDFKPIRNEWNV